MLGPKPTVPFLVRIMLANHKSCFAEVRLEEGDTISTLVDRACSRFPSWNADPAQIYLYLVSVEQARTIEQDPSSASDVCMLGHALFSGDLLVDAGVLPSSYLLALKCDGALASTYYPTSIVLPFYAITHTPTLTFEINAYHITVSTDQRCPSQGGKAQELCVPKSRDSLLSPVSFGHVAQIALVSARHWLTVAFQRVGGSLFSVPSVVESSRFFDSRINFSRDTFVYREEPLGDGANGTQRTLNFGGAVVVDGVAGANEIKED